MLIRLVSHPKNNSDHIDKMIYIEGLPESMIYRVKDGKKFLKEPWVVDNEDNVPDRIKTVFFKNPVTVWYELPKDPTFLNQQNAEYSVEANCFKIDYQTRQGEEVWKSIEKLLDRETPRDMEIPEPEVVGDRRDWTLEAADVPSVVLEKRVPVIQKVVIPDDSSPQVEEKPEVKESEPIKAYKNGRVRSDKRFNCEVCGKEFKEFGIDIHRKKMHGLDVVKQEVTA